MKRLLVILILLTLPAALISAESRAWQSFAGYRSADLHRPSNGKTGFSLLPPDETGIRFTNQLAPSRSLTNQIYLNGSGVAAGDVDGDGWCDLYFCGLDSQNALYRNLGGWKFENITAAAGVACADQASTGAALADLDGDGDLDLLVNAIARGTRLFVNDGHARFDEVTAQAGLSGKSGSMSLAIADVNGDGFLDIYVVNYRSSTFRDEPEKQFRVETRNGKHEVTSVNGRTVAEPDLMGRFSVDPVTGLLEHGEADVLYLSEGGTRFRRVDWGEGTFTDENGIAIATPYDWGLSAMFRDLNEDGAPDLYVCNDFQSPDRIWINQRGKFRTAPPSAFSQTSLFSMGVDFADLDGDGREEIFVADMLSRLHQRRQTQVMETNPGIVSNVKLEPRPQVSRNTLLWNRGDGSYAEIAQLSGLEASEWSWSPAFMDVDLDGRSDLLVSTGHERDAQHIDVAREIEAARKQNIPWRELIELRRKFPKLTSPILAFQNKGNLSFTETTAEWGFTTSQITQGMALADLDNDGDLDLAANCLNSSALLYRNETPAARIALKLRADKPNTHAIGARISVRVNGLPLQTQQVVAAGRYLSSDDFTKTFAVRENQVATIEVLWPNQQRTLITNAPANRIYEIRPEALTPLEAKPSSPSTLLFEEISSQLNHQHKDEPFDDFQRQPLLPRKYSELGPSVSWFDFDGDGWEDLFVGAGRTGSLAYFKNNRGILSAEKLPHISAASRRDQAAILGWSHGTNRTLLINFSNYEDAQTNGPSVIALTHGANTIQSVLPADAASVGALALGDADADGDLDLFVASRIIPGRFPEPPSSTFLRNEKGSFQLDHSLNEAFKSVGLVSAAIWSDLTRDGNPELLLAVEGGPLRVFTFVNGRFKELTTDLGFDRYTGWWQSITTGDFNNDGRMDVVAGNLGRNSKYQRFMADGYNLYYGDVAETGTMLILEAVRDSESSNIVPLMDRDSLALMLPDLRQRYPTFASFSTSTVAQILGSRAEKTKTLHINTSESMLFLSSGSSAFRAVPLPLEAQFAPVFGLGVGDVDADGNQDLILAQNLFSVGKRTSRYDAGEGLLLLGDGKGNLSPLPSNRSGIKMKAEGRAVALCDFDHDGRLDFVTGQNYAQTKAYRNKAPRSGLRVVLRGGEPNPHAIGAQVRLRYNDGTFGPIHEIRAGEGYWSQASSTLVLGMQQGASELEVVWPGGKLERIPIPAEAAELIVNRKN